MKSEAKLWHRILLVALAGMVPMVAITLFVIGASINKQIAFGEQEMRGNVFQRPLEQLLDLLPRHEAMARKALAGDVNARAQLPGLQNQVDQALAAVAVVYHDLGGVLKFNDAELASRQRDNGRLS